MAAFLRDCQIAAVHKMKNGCILCGGTGSGKSRTSLAYYHVACGGNHGFLDGSEIFEYPPKPEKLYIITTAKKRDSFEWDEELSYILMVREGGPNKHKLPEAVIDSWNNISRYEDVKGGFFIFDEQRAVGKGKWAKTFINISKKNHWIMLSATPGDKWDDYIPVFVANGFYRNRTDFNQQHVIFKPYTNYPCIDRYINQGKLVWQRNHILVDIDFKRETEPHHENVYVPYDRDTYKVVTGRWNPYSNEPIVNVSELCKCWQRVINSDPSRGEAILKIMRTTVRAIIFYNYDYELDILRNLDYGDDVEVAEWNGHKHQEIPKSSRWVYLVNYMAGAEGWNCTTTDTIIFYSQTYSHRTLKQAEGRIDRLNTPFKDLYYYHIKSKAPIDVAISKALKSKQIFNERKYVNL